MKTRYFLLSTMLLSSLLFAQKENQHVFHHKITPIPKQIAVQMHQYTWHKDCPVPMEQLVYLKLSYWGFDKKTHTGNLIVHQELAKEVVVIFQTLYHHHFPIQSMELMDAFKGDDNASMTANNTSAFNCRAVTNRPGEYSQHSYGRAIDINPLLNPYVHDKNIMPAEGANYADRSTPAPGKIIKGDLVYQEFIKYGWDWAGNWYDLQDYQHFEKRAHGEKRNPYGYSAK